MGEGGKTLSMVGPLREELFLRLSLPSIILRIPKSRFAKNADYSKSVVRSDHGSCIRW